MQHDAEQDRQAHGRDRLGHDGALPQLLDREEGEDDRGQAARTEPADEEDRWSVETRADQCKSDRQHPQDGEAEQRVENGRHVEVVDHDRHQRRAEEEPHEEREELPDELRQLHGHLDLGRVLLQLRPEGDPGHEGRDEPVPVQGHGEREAAERRGQGGQSSATPDDPAPPRPPGDEQPATQPHREPDADPDGQLAQGIALGGMASTGYAQLGRGHRQGEGHDRRHDPVVEPALDIEGPSEPHRDLLVVDHLRAQSGVGGRQRRRDEAHHGQRQVGEAPRRNDRAQHQRERQAHPEQTCRDADVLAQPHHIDPGRVREEKERKRGLRQDMHRWRVDVDGEGTPVRVRQQVAGDRQEQGTRDVGPDQEPRHHGPAQDQERDGSERGLRHLLFLRPQGSVGSGDSAAASRRRLRRTVMNTIVIATVVTSPEMTNDASGKSPSA